MDQPTSDAADAQKFSLSPISEEPPNSTTDIVLPAGVTSTDEGPAESIPAVILEAANMTLESLPVFVPGAANGATAILPAVIQEAVKKTTYCAPVVSEYTAKGSTSNQLADLEKPTLSSTDSQSDVIPEAANGSTGCITIVSEDAAKVSSANLRDCPEEVVKSSTIIKDFYNSPSAKSLGPSSLFISREEMERIKRRLTLAPGKAEAFLPMSSMDNFCKKSQEAVNMGLNEPSSGLLRVSQPLDTRKSFAGFLPSSQLAPSSSSGISWRDELKALKEELALPASVSLKISGMEKTFDKYTENKAASGKSDELQKDEDPGLNLVEKPVAPLLHEVFLKELDLDFLSTIGSGRIDSNLARQSVFVNFDPVVEKALKEANPSGDQRKGSSTESTRQKNEISEEDSIRRLTAVQKQISNNRKRDLKELDDLIEKLMLEIEEQESKGGKMPKVLSTTEQTELLMKLDGEIERLRVELSEQPAEIQQLLDEIDECDQLIVQLTDDKEKFEANKGKLLEEQVQDTNSHKEHLDYMEEMFDNLYQNYQKAKESRKGLIYNKTVLEKHNQYLTDVDNKFKENLEKIKAEHEQTIMNAKKELASQELKIRELKKQRAYDNVPQTFHC